MSLVNFSPDRKTGEDKVRRFDQIKASLRLQVSKKLILKLNESLQALQKLFSGSMSGTMELALGTSVEKLTFHCANVVVKWIFYI